MSSSFRGVGFDSPALRIGVALAVTVGGFYTLCTLIWLAAPGPFMSFMNGLFHGLDFSVLLRPAPFSFAGYVESLAVMTVWAFLAGTFFGWLRDLLA